MRDIPVKAKYANGRQHKMIKLNKGSGNGGHHRIKAGAMPLDPCPAYDPSDHPRRYDAARGRYVGR